MISQTGMETLIKNIFTLTIQSDPVTSKKITDIALLGLAFHRYLDVEKKRKPCGLAGQVNIISDFKKSQEFCKAMQADALSLLDDMQQDSVISITEEKDAERKKDLISRAIEEMGKYSHEHKTLFDLIITDVFIMPSHKARGGSTSAALGVIWANPKLVYPINDVVEFLVHPSSTVARVSD